MWDAFRAGKGQFVIFFFERRRTNENNSKREHKQGTRSRDAQFWFLGQILLAEDALKLFRAPEHKERHQDDEKDNNSHRQMENLIESQATIIACVGVPVVKIFFGFAEEECAEEATEDKEHAIHFAGGRGCQ